MNLEALSPQPQRIAYVSRTRTVLLSVAVILVVLAVAWHRQAASKRASSDAHANVHPPVRVDTAATRRVDVPIYLSGLGTVQAFYTVKITARVDGELQKIGFTEGETLKKGAFIAQIDPRPFQAALDQALAVKAKDSAQLQSARQDLQRYTVLAPEELTSKQSLDAQRALVAQLRAQIKGDEATIENARTQLAYTTITAPIEGRTGIRLVDPGNIVRASDTTGIVVLTEVQPISLIFAVPEDQLPAVSRALAAGPVVVAALSRDEKTEFDHGTLALIDNQIDQTTGTARLKATFSNRNNQLWPGEFINARVLVEIAHNALTIPSKAVQHGPDGVFAYVVKSDSTVEARPLQIGTEGNELTVVTQGLSDGEIVTTNNQYRLQPGTQVRAGANFAPGHGRAHSGKGRPQAASAAPK